MKISTSALILLGGSTAIGEVDVPRIVRLYGGKECAIGEFCLAQKEGYHVTEGYHVSNHSDAAFNTEPVNAAHKREQPFSLPRQAASHTIPPLLLTLFYIAVAVYFGKDIIFNAHEALMGARSLAVTFTSIIFCLTADPLYYALDVTVRSRMSLGYHLCTSSVQVLLLAEAANNYLVLNLKSKNVFGEGFKWGLFIAIPVTSAITIACWFIFFPTVQSEWTSLGSLDYSFAIIECSLLGFLALANVIFALLTKGSCKDASEVPISIPMRHQIRRNLLLTPLSAVVQAICFSVALFSIDQPSVTNERIAMAFSILNAATGGLQAVFSGRAMISVCSLARKVMPARWMQSRLMKAAEKIAQEQKPEAKQHE